MTTQSIAIIGAGVAGFSCAQRLIAAGRTVRVFDKGRSVGGRVSTRRVQTPMGPAQFDHGAQFFTARDTEFLKTIASWPGASAVLWEGAGTKDGWRVGAPGMSALAKQMSDGLDVHVSTRVESITRQGAMWQLKSHDGAVLGAFDTVIVAVPPEQAAPLLAPVAPALAQEASDAITAPCWAGLFAFAAPTGAGQVAYEWAEHPVLSWLACDSAKPARGAAPECWVAHAHPAWTRAHLEESPEPVTALLLEAVQSVLGRLPEPIYASAHRWRYAKVERAAGSPFGWDADLRLGTCGDWRLGPRLECAWQSGRALAGAIIS